MEAIYTLKKDVISDENGNDSVGYTICAHRLTGEVAQIVPQAFTDKKEAMDFIELCNTERLELTHLYNALEDMKI